MLGGTEPRRHGHQEKEQQESAGDEPRVHHPEPCRHCFVCCYGVPPRADVRGESRPHMLGVLSLLFVNRWVLQGCRPPSPGLHLNSCRGTHSSSICSIKPDMAVCSYLRATSSCAWNFYFFLVYNGPVALCLKHVILFLQRAPCKVFVKLVWLSKEREATVGFPPGCFPYSNRSFFFFLFFSNRSANRPGAQNRGKVWRCDRNFTTYAAHICVLMFASVLATLSRRSQLGRFVRSVCYVAFVQRLVALSSARLPIKTETFREPSRTLAQVHEFKSDQHPERARETRLPRFLSYNDPFKSPFLHPSEN